MYIPSHEYIPVLLTHPDSVQACTSVQVSFLDDLSQYLQESFVSHDPPLRTKGYMDVWFWTAWFMTISFPGKTPYSFLYFCFRYILTQIDQ